MSTFREYARAALYLAVDELLQLKEGLVTTYLHYNSLEDRRIRAVCQEFIEKARRDEREALATLKELIKDE